MINNREGDAVVYVVMGIIIATVLAVIFHSWWDSGLKDDYEDRLADRDETIRAQYLEIIKHDSATLAEAVEYVDGCTRGYSFMSKALKKAGDKEKKSEDKEHPDGLDADDPPKIPSAHSSAPSKTVDRDGAKEDFIELLEKDADVHQDALVYVAQYLIRTSSIDIIDGNYDKNPHYPEYDHYAY